MENLITTFLFVLFLLLACVCLLGIGRLLTGKSRLRTGMCGKIPKKPGEKSSCDERREGCSLCGTDTRDSEDVEKK